MSRKNADIIARRAAQQYEEAMDLADRFDAWLQVDRSVDEEGRSAHDGRGQVTLMRKDARRILEVLEGGSR